MSTFDDSSFEMHNDSLTPDTAERLIDGEILSPEFADLVAVVNDVRTAASATPIPEVRGALAEYVGVGLTATEMPAIESASAAVGIDLDLTTADQPRSKSVFAEVLTFAGTVGGKLLLGGAVAAASITGAQASGLVDVPGLPDRPETVVVADDPIEIPTELPLEDELEKDEVVEEETKPADADAVEDETKDKKEEADIADAEDKKAEEKDEPVEEPKKEEPKKEEPKHEEPKEEPKHEEPSDYDRAVDALEEQLHKDKEAEYAAATELIKPLEADKKALVEALEATLGELEQARNEAKAPLYEELETTEDPERRAEIEEELQAIYEQWELDRDAAKAEAHPAINDIEQQLETIELDRDAEIERLIEQFRADVDALQK